MGSSDGQPWGVVLGPSGTPAFRSSPCNLGEWGVCTGGTFSRENDQPLTRFSGSRQQNSSEPCSIPEGKMGSEWPACLPGYTVTEWSPVGLQTSTAPMFRCYKHCKALFYGLRLTRSASSSLQKPAILSSRSREGCL